MNSIKEYSHKYNFDDNNNFAVACYNQNSIEELTAIAIAVKNGADIDNIADKIDCKNWKISPVQWFEGILAALQTKELE